jgi:squalene-hopene/tetraprenyl-beta-curcumene cyclase
MNSAMIDHDRLVAAYEKARYDLLSERTAEGYWEGELSSSALATATAVSAMAVIERHDAMDAVAGCYANEARESYLSELIMGGVKWLAERQNPDGGWGDTEQSQSNIATTMLVVAAFRLTCVPAKYGDLMSRALKYIEQHGGLEGLRRRYGKDKTFAVPILTNYALADLVPWSKVPPLPFEAAAIPQRFFRFLGLPVVSYAIPALVAIGQARYFHKRPLNPITRWLRGIAVKRSLKVLERMQPFSGGYLEAVPLTSFVVMSLGSTGRVHHPVTQKGLEFLVDSVRADGSWPIDTNLATWNTTLAMNGLAQGGEEISELCSLDWLLDCQHQEAHPYTGAAPGGWGWSDLSGAVPDADDTPGALLALRAFYDSPSCSQDQRRRIRRSAAMGVKWLLDLQNADGGWPTFCRGWTELPFDRSGSDLTAHAIRALSAWKREFFGRRIETAVERGFTYLEEHQRPDGAWIPLWFGNEGHPREENPLYGTAKVLLAYRDTGRPDNGVVRRALDWLQTAQNADGGWGGREVDVANKKKRAVQSSIEETALALEALMSWPVDSAREGTIKKGLERLLTDVETDRHRAPSPIGLYFAKLWYYEKLYPLIFTVSALGQAARAFLPHPARQPAAARLRDA